MSEELKVWIDGTLYSKEDAKISVFDHCVLYGDGVFEGIRIYSGWCEWVVRLSEFDAKAQRTQRMEKVRSAPFGGGRTTDVLSYHEVFSVALFLALFVWVCL